MGMRIKVTFITVMMEVYNGTSGWLYEEKVYKWESLRVWKDIDSACCCSFIGLPGLFQHPPYTHVLSSPVAPSLKFTHSHTLMYMYSQNKKENSCAYNTFPYIPFFSLNSTVWQFGRFSHKQVYLIRKILHSIYMRYGAGLVYLPICVCTFVNVMKILI